MLQEIPARQVAGEPHRKWFADDNFDLIVWYGPEGEITGFQLCYDKLRNQRALTWHKDGGYTHDRIDDGEHRAGGFKGTPILVHDGAFDKGTVVRAFTEASGALDPQLTASILKLACAYAD